MRLKVICLHPNGQDFECRDEGDKRIFVDLFIDGALPKRVTAEDLIGKTVEVDGLDPYLYLAANPRIVS